MQSRGFLVGEGGTPEPIHIRCFESLEKVPLWYWRLEVFGTRWTHLFILVVVFNNFVLLCVPKFLAAGLSGWKHARSDNGEDGGGKGAFLGERFLARLHLGRLRGWNAPLRRPWSWVGLKEFADFWVTRAESVSEPRAGRRLLKSRDL